MALREDKDGHFVSSIISAQNTFTQALFISGPGDHRFEVLVVAGTYVATPTVQISEDNLIWTDLDLNNFRAMTDIGGCRCGQMPGDFYIRVGCKTGDYTSGNIEMHIKRSF